MASWDAEQYLKFAEERTRPCHDLVSRIQMEPHRVVDLGCGPGNSTAVLAARWPKAHIMGIDSSNAMIEEARKKFPQGQWEVQDICSFSKNAAGTWDLVFSNAALQWVPQHEEVFPALLEVVGRGGALAVQIPSNWDGPAHQTMRTVAKRFGLAEQVREWFVHSFRFYYDLLAARASRLEIWETSYIHIMPDAEAIVEWYKGTGLRPFLQVLQTEQDRQRFTHAYMDAIRQLYPPQADGSVLFPFQRMFLIAYK